ncbi:MAG: hypothetical protein GF330_12785 [Candidatus Eisenbacteria bacterium]|nr:hypothetical protein [Candidatus Eisenbacteria bacterium]
MTSSNRCSLIPLILWASILALVALVASAAFAEQVTWSGAGGNQNWDNPDNWDGGRVPGLQDDVTIPADTPTCNVNTAVDVNSLTNAGGMTSTGYVTISSFGPVQNSGNMDAGGHLSIGCASGDFTNSGTVTGGSVDVNASNVANQGSIVSDGSDVDPLDHGIVIEANHDFSNEGSIFCGATDTNGDASSCFLKAWETFDNYSDIATAHGQGTGNGGDLVIVGIGEIRQHPFSTIYAGNAGPEGSHAGELRLLGRTVRMSGSAKSGDSDDKLREGAASEARAGGDLTLAGHDRPLGGIEVIGRTIEIHMGSTERALEGAGIHLRGRFFDIHDLTRFGAIYSYQDEIQFYSCPCGEVDFSGTHTDGAIFAWQSSVGIHTPVLIEPAEGIDYIIEPDPIIEDVDPSWIDSYAHVPTPMAPAGTVDSFEVKYQNLCTEPQLLEFEISSAFGWVTADTTSADLRSFDFDSLFVHFQIPPGTPSGTEDEITVTITIDPDYEEQFTASLVVFPGDDSGVDDPLPTARLALRATPMPFTSSCQIFARDSFRPIEALRIHDLAGRRVWSWKAEGAAANGGGHARGGASGPVTWRPDPSLPGGVYIVTARAGDARLGGRLVYVR